MAVEEGIHFHIMWRKNKEKEPEIKPEKLIIKLC